MEGPRSALARRGEASLTVSRSRFLAIAAPAADPAALADLLAGVRAAHRDARHIPHAWVDAAGATRSSDDGEPSGTGGHPCLEALTRPGLRCAAVAVARIFGGTLLGAANLARAYGQAAAAAVEAGGVVALRLHRWVQMDVGYGEQDRAERALARAGARQVQRRYDGGVGLAGWVPADALEGLRSAVPGARTREGGEAWL